MDYYSDYAVLGCYCANCGHPPLLHYDEKRATLSLLRTGNPALGLSAQSEYSQDRISISAGDIFLFYSGGLPETVDADGREFSQDQLQRLVLSYADQDPEEIYSHLIITIAQYRSGSAQLNDITVLITKVQVR
ncbi:MAG: PP2C family protein-serine/threonine phosphatase [candidate division KSB1 bacterium]|nr:PP2C family protein-serine/threonine phosphatase [candidate division KSB1 bacterium]